MLCKLEDFRALLLLQIQPVAEVPSEARCDVSLFLEVLNGERTPPKLRLENQIRMLKTLTRETPEVEQEIREVKKCMSTIAM